MSSENQPTNPTNEDRILRVRIEEEMEQSYIDYAMSVIAGRALPDVRDGLKPVHRRILYAMHQIGVTSSSSPRKASSIVGQTMGDFHPHGDSAIYDALVRMAQPFSMRYPLIEGQGNFGSVDGDHAAAMRYTEARMEKITEEYLSDIDRDTVDFQPNYDDRLSEPTVLPTQIPGLLLNGSSGIAVGMSTNIPPHNLGELIDATVHIIDQPDCDVTDLIDLPDNPGPVVGPDFPTGGAIVGREGIHDAYTTGRGRIRIRASYEVEPSDSGDKIVITEIPYQVNKSRMVTHIANLANDGVIEGITDLRDESNRDGIRVVVELSRSANTDVVQNQLLGRVFETSFGVINLALVDGQPQILNLKESLCYFIDHRKEVVTRRSEFDLYESEERAHILEGRLIALERIDDVVNTIRGASNRTDAKQALRDLFGLSEVQSEHIVRMQLGSLTQMESVEIQSEHANLLDQIKRLETILSDESELLKVIKEELLKIREKYSSERRTEIVPDTGKVSRDDLIPQENVVIVVTESDYIKRMPISTFKAQHRGGKGIIGTALRDKDQVATVFFANTHDYLLCFTNLGRVYRLKVYDVPTKSRTARGVSAVNVLKLGDGEEIAAVVATTDFEPGEYFTMITRDGYIKRTSVESFQNIRTVGIVATKLEDGDELVDVVLTNGTQELVISTNNGKSIRFADTQVRSMGRSARGVRAIRLNSGDSVAGVAAVGESSSWILTLTEHGYGKRSLLDAYRIQSRNGKGVIDIKTVKRNGGVCAIKTVREGDHLIAITEKGQIMRTIVDGISLIGRNTMGVTIMDVDKGDRLASVDIIPSSGVGDFEMEPSPDEDVESPVNGSESEPSPDEDVESPVDGSTDSID
ncbi:MAG TPA: DNA gyrase subunit A [Halobacteriales archaeon]|uniref:DNA gyrase subunit A n=1 Tax=Candidatus Hikarchaeum yamanae TaxID=2675326 RepID=UPI0018535137|nr:DNA gyrase subunit A [Halobacteriales archaeon]|tara:strand:- start:9851 stop:12445 length:2595 start_codon:yes stop_codon:yes gene_type:complete